MNIKPSAPKVMTALVLAAAFATYKSILVSVLVFIAAYGIWSFLEK